MKSLLSIVLICPIISYATPINCKVVGISDGDTIKCLTAQKELLKIRLYQIDAPEKKQAFGQRSKQALSDMIFNKTVKIKRHGQDKYRRTLGTIYAHVHSGCSDSSHTGNCTRFVDINLKMIKQGMAWYYPFAKENSTYKQAEETVRNNKIGLWSQRAIAPWEFRK